MRRTVLAALAALIIAVPALADAPHPQKPGKWQINVQMEMPGMPVKMPPIKFEVCLTEEDLKDPQKAVPQDPKGDCQVGDYEIDGNTVTWTMSCPKQKVSGKGSITFDDTSYSGVMQMKMGEQEMKSNYTGKWLGECTK
jgi:hypothetical protein